MAIRSDRGKGETLPFTSVNRTREGEVTFFRVRGEASASAFIDAYRDFLTDPTRLALWDMRACRLARLDHDQLRPLVSAIRRFEASGRPRARTAFVCRGEDDANVMRLLVAYGEASGYATEMAVFGNVTRAQHWLAGDEPRDPRPTLTP